jgi:membrane protein DedA with SNARE-associated domain
VLDNLFAAIASWIIAAVETGGYVAVGGLTLLENLIPPIPSELILPAAGFLVRQGALSFAWVVVAATVGSLAGALILYELGRWLGEQRVRELARSHGRWLALGEGDVDRARGWFERHGNEAVLICRLIPAMRSIISIPAGLVGMPRDRFVLYTTLGSGLWNAALVGAGWLLADQWERITPYLDVLQWGTLLVLVAWAGWSLWHRSDRRQGMT